MDMGADIDHNLSAYSGFQTRLLVMCAQPAKRKITRRRPVQKRAQVTVDAIVEATAQILSTDGYAGFTTNRVATRAGVSIGTLYQYFTDKEAILRLLCERHVANVRDSVFAQLAQVDAASLEEGTRGIMRAVLRAQMEHRDVNRILLEQIPRLMGFEHLEQIHGLIQTLVRDALNRRRAQLRPDLDLDVTTFVLVHAVFGVSTRAVRALDREIDEARLLDELTAMVLRYLRADEASARDALAPG